MLAYLLVWLDVIKSEDYAGWIKVEGKYKAEQTNEKRLLDSYSDSNLAVSFTEQSTSRVIVSEISKQVDSKDRAVAFMNWFFSNYNEKMDADSDLAKLSYVLPDRNNDLQDTKKLYFGAENGNALADKLFQGTDHYPLCYLGQIYNGEDVEGFKEFIIKCGVLSYPPIESFELSKLDDSLSFKSYVKGKYRFQIVINYLIFLFVFLYFLFWYLFIIIYIIT